MSFFRLPMRNGRICVPGAYFPGEVVPAGIKLATRPGAPDDRRLKKSAQGTISWAVRKQRREAVLKAFKRLGSAKPVAEEQGCQLSYVYKILKAAGVDPKRKAKSK